MLEPYAPTPTPPVGPHATHKPARARARGTTQSLLEPYAPTPTPPVGPHATHKPARACARGAG